LIYTINSKYPLTPIFFFSRIIDHPTILPFSLAKYTLFGIFLSGVQHSTYTEYIDYLINELPKSLGETDTDLFNIRDEMLAQLHKLKYLLTLS